MKQSEIQNMRINFPSLCKMANELGYKDSFYQLMLENGSSVGDLMLFFEDNPGAIEAVFEWVGDQKWDSLEEEDDEEDLHSMCIRQSQAF